MVWSSEHGYECRSLIDNWTQIIVSEQKNRSIRMFLEGGQFVMYFMYGKDIYACGENSRVTYSKMLKPDEETTEDWCEQANFQAFNLSKAIKGQSAQEMFFYSDVDKIDILTKDEAYEKLVKIAEDASPEKVNSGISGLFQALKSMSKKPDMPLNQGTKK